VATKAWSLQPKALSLVGGAAFVIWESTDRHSEAGPAASVN